MSGGKDRKSRTSKTQGWEEAGGEFYQESYPADWDGMQRETVAIATLLPSKQNRVATTRRVRVGQAADTKTSRRRGGNGGTGGGATMASRYRRESTPATATTGPRRGSQYQDVQVAMLPDLSENLTDEERIWEEIHEIKTLPISMAQKKEMKAQLQNATKLRLQGFDQIKWQRRKAWQQFKSKWRECIAKLELWKSALKTIEGNYGTGVAAYFYFLRWLVFLNVGLFTLLFAFVILPQIVLRPATNAGTLACDETNSTTSTQCCAEQYLNATDAQTERFVLVDLVQGTGFMERTLMFYGMYSSQMLGHDSYANRTERDELAGQRLQYDLRLAYVALAVVVFFVSLVAIVKSAFREFTDHLIEGQGQVYRYCNLVFGGWDFCIHNEKSALLKHKALHNEIRAMLHARRMEVERHNRSRQQTIKLMATRTLVNVTVLLILGCAGYLIFVLFNISMAQLDPNFDGTVIAMEMANVTDGEELAATPLSERSTADEMHILFFEFLPYLAIVALNMLVPQVFNYLVQFERYSPIRIVKMNLMRTVLLRLSSLAVLLSRFYQLVMAPIPDGECFNAARGAPQCWETFVGQQFYKLFLVDFANHVFVTFFINFPRALFARHSRSRFARLVGEQEFGLPRHVLDVVYSQSLCWLGFFYAPLLPPIAVVLHFLTFYVKKFACLVNSKPSTILHRASHAKSLFMTVLLFSYVIAVVPVACAIAILTPSRTCGPFRGLPTVWDSVVNTFDQFPDLLKRFVFYFGTAGFAIPCFVVLTVGLYYYYAVSAANRHLVDVLKNQLVLEGHDKQFLLNRLSAFIKQQQEHQRKEREARGRERAERAAERLSRSGGGSAAIDTEF